MLIIMLWLIILHDTIATCTDTSNGAVDNWGDGCDDYAQNLHWCGNYNNDALQSEVMCCACGGGSWA